jgi:RNA polymerase sigma factor (sigma-70 family)
MLMTNQTLHHSELWDQVCKGNQQAYASLHQLLYPCLYIYAKRIVNDADDADDMLQDLFIKLWNRKSVIGKIGNVKSYFYTALRSVAINHLRGLKSQHSKHLQMGLVDLQPSVEDILIAGENSTEQRQVVKAALQKLPLKQREVIFLRFYDNMEYAQIVEITGIKYQSVVNHIHRAITLLRNELKIKQSMHAA